MSTRSRKIVFLRSRARSVTLGWQPYRHLRADCADNVGSSTSRNPIGLHCLLRHFFYTYWAIQSSYLLWTGKLKHFSPLKSCRWNGKAARCISASGSIAFSLRLATINTHELTIKYLQQDEEVWKKQGSSNFLFIFKTLTKGVRGIRGGGVERRSRYFASFFERLFPRYRTALWPSVFLFLCEIWCRAAETLRKLLASLTSVWEVAASNLGTDAYVHDSGVGPSIRRQLHATYYPLHYQQRH
jgi:hypothetical protein